MLVEQIWTANDYRNFNYLIACPEAAKRWPSNRLMVTTCDPEVEMKVRALNVTMEFVICRYANSFVSFTVEAKLGA